MTDDGCHFSPAECAASATSYLGGCLGGYLRPTGTSDDDPCCPEGCAGCHMSPAQWTPSSSDRARSPEARRKCKAPRCKWWRSLCTKSFLIVVNLTFLIGGWVIFGMGIWLYVHQDSFLVSQLLKENPTNPFVVFEKVPCVLIAIGFFISITGFLGCCGTCADSVCFLSFYSLLLIIAVLAEISIALLILFCQTQIVRDLRASMQYQIQNEYNRTASPLNATALDVYRLTLAWDSMQIKMNCCGVDSPHDYMHTSWYNHSKDTEGVFVPQSCCVMRNENTRRPRVLNENFCQVEAILYPKSSSDKTNNDTLDHLKTQGCQPAVIRWLHGYIPQAVFLLLLLVALEVVDLILSCILMAWVRKRQSEYWWCEDEEYE